MKRSWSRFNQPTDPPARRRDLPLHRWRPDSATERRTDEDDGGGGGGAVRARDARRIRSQTDTNVAELVAGEPIRDSWWAHPWSYAIFEVLNVVADSSDVVRTHEPALIPHQGRRRRVRPAHHSLHRLAPADPAGAPEAHDISRPPDRWPGCRWAALQPGASARRRSDPPLWCALHRVARGRRARRRPRKDRVLDGGTSALLGLPEDLFDPTEPGDRGREATGRDGEQGDVPDLGSCVPRLERLARVRPHRTLRERAHRERQLDESLCAGVQRTGQFSRPPRSSRALATSGWAPGRRGRSSADAVPWLPLKGLTPQPSTHTQARGSDNAELGDAVAAIETALPAALGPLSAHP